MFNRRIEFSDLAPGGKLSAEFVLGRLGGAGPMFRLVPRGGGV